MERQGEQELTLEVAGLQDARVTIVGEQRALAVAVTLSGVKV